MKKLKIKSAISRGGYKPKSDDEARKLVVEFILGTIGTAPTVLSQTLVLNVANYNWLTSIPDTAKPTQSNQSVLHKTVKELNEFCRLNKFPLGLLIMPHTSSSDYSGDEVIAIPWKHVAANSQSQSAVNSIFETVIADGYPQFVADAKTLHVDVEGSDVL